MIVKKLVKTVALLGLAGAVASGCAKYSRDELLSEIKSAGISDTTATCIVDGWEKAGIKVEKYGKESLTPEEEKVVTDCITKEISAGLDVPTTAGG